MYRLSVRTHNKGVFRSDPMPLVRKETQNHLEKATFLARKLRALRLLCSESSMYRVALSPKEQKSKAVFDNLDIISQGNNSIDPLAFENLLILRYRLALNSQMSSFPCNVNVK